MRIFLAVMFIITKRQPTKQKSLRGKQDAIIKGMNNSVMVCLHSEQWFCMKMSELQPHATTCVNLENNTE